MSILINESVTEDLTIKKKVWSELAQHLPKDAILTTNTSYLLPSQMAHESGNPWNFCAFHFHDVFWANVVDVMPHEGTNPEVIKVLKELGIKLNQTPVVIRKETSGYLFNSMLLAILNAAGELFAMEKATIQDIDRSWMGNFKMPIGPFGMIDEIGIDTAWHVVKNINDPRSKNFENLLKSMMDKGRLGAKTSSGFYDYPNPEFKNPDFLIKI